MKKRILPRSSKSKQKFNKPRKKLTSKKYRIGSTPQEIVNMAVVLVEA